MKKTVLLLMLIGLLYPIKAQINSDIKITNEDVKITTGNNGKLHVVGDTYVTQSIYLESTSGFLGTTNNVPIIFKVNGILAGFTGNSTNSNVSFGYKALSPLTGSESVAIGSEVLSLNTTGKRNTAIGTKALYSNTSGAENTAYGLEALTKNTTGGRNTAIGVMALNLNTTGIYNTAVGVGALTQNATGSYNTAIGYTAGASGSPSNSTAIGYQASAGSNQVRVGNSSVTSIGGYAGWSNVSDGRAKKNIRTEVPGLAFIKHLQPVTYNLNLDVIDELQKSDDPKINAFRDSLRMARSPEEKEMEAKSRENKEKIVYSGFIAQDVEKAARNLGYNFSGVDVPEDGKGAYGLRYAEFVVPLVKAVQELSEQNDTKDAAIASLQKQVNELKGLRVQNDHLQDQVNALTGLVYQLMGKEPDELKSGLQELANTETETK